MTLDSGSQLGPYEVVGALGAGGMGEVYRARDPRLGREVAIKVLPEDLARDPQRLRRFEQEARAVASFDHPNVLAIHDVGNLDGIPYLVSELLEGRTLRQRLSEGTLTVRAVLDLALQAAEGLAAAHARGIVHRDLKPENLFLTWDGRLKILDFGLAKVEPPRGQGASTAGADPDALATDPDAVVGTATYMSPEQVRRLPVDCRSDLFSLGATLYELLARERPFAGETAVETMMAILRQDAPPLSGRHPEISPALDRLILRCLEKRPGDRFQSAHDLALALEAVAASDAAHRPRATTPRREERSPYPGLAPFTESDAEHFYGRKGEVAAVRRKLQQRHLLALIGPSGAGKTSFLRAGLVPALPPGWRAISCQPGPRPFVALAQALLPELSGDSEAVSELLRFDEPEVVLSLLARWRARHEHALLIVDPFEELFTTSDPEVQARFAELLGRLTAETEVHVLLSMRDDFLFRCNAYPALRSVFSELTPIAPPAGAELRHALVQPALQRGYRFEDDALVGQMLGEVSEERGALPLLAFAAAKLWEARDLDRRLLTRAAYEGIGGVGGALARHAEATLERIGREREDLVRELFRNLVTAQGTRAVRDREPLLSVFEGSSSWTRRDAAEVLDALVDARLLTRYEVLGDAESESRQRVEIIHESLLAEWPRLVRWQTQDADGAQLRDQLRQASQLWHARGRPADLLWTGTAYRDLALWKERYPGGLSSQEEDFAAAAAHSAGRRRRRRRVVAAAILAAATAVAAVTSLLWRRAEAETLRAEASQLLALGQARLDDDPTAALAYTLASLERADSSEARRFAVEALSRGPMRIQVSDRETWKLAFSPDRRWLAVSGFPWSLPPDQELELWPRDGGAPVTFPGDGETLFANAPGAGPLMVSRRVREGGGQDLRIRSVPDWGLIRTLAFDGVTGFDTPPGKAELRTRSVVEEAGGRQRVLLQSWPLEGGAPAELARFDRDEVGPWAIAEDPTGRLLAFVDRGGRIFVAPAGRVEASARRLIARPDSDVSSLSFHPDGRSLGVLETNGRIRLYPLAGNGSPRTLQEPLEDRTGGPLLFSPDGSRLASERRRLVRLWGLDPPLADPILLRSSEAGQVNALAFDASGRWLAMAANSGASIWPLDHRYPRVLRGHTGDVTSVVFDPRGRWLASASADATVRLWSLREGSPRPSRVLFRGEAEGCLAVVSLAVDPEGRRVLAGCERGGVWVVPTDAGPSRHLAGFEGQVKAVAFGPHGRRAAGAGGAFDRSEAVIRVWDLESGEVRVLASSDDTWIGWCLQFTADGRIVSSGDSGVRLWDVDAGRFEVLHSSVGRGPRAEDVDRFASSPWGSEVCAGRPSDPAAWSCRDLESGRTRPLDVTAHGEQAQTFALDPTGTVLVSGDSLGVVRAAPLAGGPPQLLLGHEGNVMRVAVSPDGRWIASAGFDGTVRLWPMPDVEATPLQARPLGELLDALRALTNLRVAEDPHAPNGYRIEAGAFPGWETPPAW